MRSKLQIKSVVACEMLQHCPHVAFLVCCTQGQKDDGSLAAPVSTRATALSVVGDHVWLGTANGYLLINKIISASSPEAEDRPQRSSSMDGKEDNEQAHEEGGGQQDKAGGTLGDGETTVKGGISVEGSVLEEGNGLNAAEGVRLQLVQLHRVSEDAVRCMAAAK